jgi:exonuclease III
MKILSWNVRGLGGLEKRKEVRGLIGEMQPWIVCIQETKLGSCDDFLCGSMWGNVLCDFSYRPSVGASGGVLTMWDTSAVEVWSTVSLAHALMIHGRFIQSQDEFFLFNVYAPCESHEKLRLWEVLPGRLQQLVGQKVCVCGDFNAVRSDYERISVRQGVRSPDQVAFNRFIDDSGLVDLPLCGRNFTWYKRDGSSMSRIDRFLLSEDWCLSWPNCVQQAQLRGLSDHCPLLLSVDVENWGPRPLRMLKCWQDIPGYKQFVISTWQSLHVE